MEVGGGLERPFSHHPMGNIESEMKISPCTKHRLVPFIRLRCGTQEARQHRTMAGHISLVSTPDSSV